MCVCIYMYIYIYIYILERAIHLGSRRLRRMPPGGPASHRLPPRAPPSAGCGAPQAGAQPTRQRAGGVCAAPDPVDSSPRGRRLLRPRPRARAPRRKAEPLPGGDDALGGQTHGSAPPRPDRRARLLDGPARAGAEPARSRR